MFFPFLFISFLRRFFFLFYSSSSSSAVLVFRVNCVCLLFSLSGQRLNFKCIQTSERKRIYVKAAKCMEWNGV